jgi:hypothetical protein
MPASRDIKRTGYQNASPNPLKRILKTRLSVMDKVMFPFNPKYKREK